MLGKSALHRENQSKKICTFELVRSWNVGRPGSSYLLNAGLTKDSLALSVGSVGIVFT